jgi:hypothetical protein
VSDLVECLQLAASAAARVINKPDLCTVLVGLAHRDGLAQPTGFSFGFQHQEHGLLGKKSLTTCFVEVLLDSRSVRVVSSGTYGPDQISQLAAVPGFDFPPPILKPSAVALVTPPQVVLERLQARQPGPRRLRPAQVSLVLTIYEGHIAWRAIQDVSGVGVLTLILDAVEGQVLFEKLDQEVSAAEATRAAERDA